MTITELQIQFDLNPDNRANVLKNADTCQWMTGYGYLFVDQEDGLCYFFDENGNLNDVSIVESIGYYAFWNCKFLKKIKIPNSVESIGDCAFIGCTSLTSIEIPNSVKSIGRCTFQNCTSLKSIKIPDSVESIGGGAFTYCKSLKKVIFKGKIMKQVKALEWYPWGIEDESIIKTES